MVEVGGGLIRLNILRAYVTISSGGRFGGRKMFFISQDEIEALPENPRERFVGIESIARRRYEEETRDSDQSNYVQECQLRYMTTVVSAAKYFQIAPISEIAIPKRKNFSWDDYSEFVNELQFYIVQLMLEGAENNVETSIVLRGSAKQRLQTLSSHLRENVRKLDLSPARVESLLRRVDGFDRELENPSLRFVAVAQMALLILGATADIDGASEAVRKLVHQIEEAVGVEKLEQDTEAAGRLPATSVPRQLQPPRAPAKNPASPARNAENFSADLDDEIPF